MITGLKRLTRRPALLAFLTGAIGGVLVFLVLYGTAVLDPTNDGWLHSNSDDISQHYIGWLFFRDAPWQFPVGVIPGLAYPTGIGISFTDSIPLFALIFKLFSPLPVTFQYFGWWGIACYALQGGIAGLILLRLTKSVGLSVTGSLLFVTAPVLGMRMFTHTALAGQWIILLAIYVLIRSKELSARQFISWWSVVMVLSVLIHPYFVPMNAILLLMAVILSWRTLWRGLLHLGVPLVLALAVFWAIGGLSFATIGSNDAGLFGLNLLAFVSPYGWSRFFDGPPSPPFGYESEMYVGMGVMISCLLLVLMAVWSLRSKSGRQRARKIIRRLSSPRLLLVYGCGVLLFFVAIGPWVHVANKVLELSWPSLFMHAWSVFRATARLFWPIYYLFLIGVIVLLFVQVKKRVGPVIAVSTVLLLSGLQAVEIILSPESVAKRQRIEWASTSDAPYRPLISTASWENMTAGKKHIQFTKGVEVDQFFSIAFFAQQRHLTLSNGYFARSPQAAIDAGEAHARQMLVNGTALRDTVYVSYDQAFVETLNHDGYTVTRDGKAWLIAVR